MTPLAHIVSVIAIWTMMLFGLRFAVGAAGWLRPLVRAGYRLARCNELDKRSCRRTFVHAVDQLHIDLNRAITTPWSATLLFSGSLLIGLAYFSGSLGDAAKLFAQHPPHWETFDVVTDCIAAALSVTGMSFVHAATQQRRTASFLVSGVLMFTGAGIGIFTL